MAVSKADLELAALKEFRCLPPVAGSGRKETRADRIKRGRVLSVTAKYHAVMAENPGLSREDAQRLTVGGLRILLSIFFPWVALAVTVTLWLWDYEHSSENNASVERELD